MLHMIVALARLAKECGPLARSLRICPIHFSDLFDSPALSVSTSATAYLNNRLIETVVLEKCSPMLVENPQILRC